MHARSRFNPLFPSLVALSLALGGAPSHALEFTLDGPEGSSHFGQYVEVLSNGNVVVCDPDFSPPGGPQSIGSASLYRPDGELISRLTGSQPYDHVCRYGILELANGNYLIGSDQWNNGSITAAGALTWGSATTGVSGTVSAANSLISATAHSDLGRLHEPWSYQGGVLPLANGNYLVLTPDWDHGAIDQAGAVTLGDGANGTVGLISTQNSVVGASASERFGEHVPVVLSNGNVLIGSPRWSADGIGSRGAVVWMDAVAGRHGVISPYIALVGTSASDRVGHGSGVQLTLVPLAGGNALVLSPHWDNGAAVEAGAITWLDGVQGTTGVVSAANSVIGSSGGDSLGYDADSLRIQVTLLVDGNAVVASPDWDNAGASAAGAATWFDADAPTVGVVSASNSLVGTAAGARVGQGVVPLSNGHYVVAGYSAITWGDGLTGRVGSVSAQNSFVARTPGDFASAIVRALSNGNYVVLSPHFDGASIVDVGAVTWFDGAAATSGVVSETNSLVGSMRDDFAGTGNGLNTFPALPGGGFVLLASHWSNYRGALIFGDGATPLVGSVSSDNAVLGSQRFDFVASEVHVLANGNFAVRLPQCDCGGAVDAGAVLWGSGTDGITGVLSPQVALVDRRVDANLGTWDSVVPLPNGDYVVIHSRWDAGAVQDVGKVLRVDGDVGLVGQVDDAAGLQGSSTNDQVGAGGITSLPGGGFVVESPRWNSYSATEAGAVSVILPTTSLPATVSTDSSLVGDVAGERLGLFPTHVLSNGKVVVLGTRSATWSWPEQPATGVISIANSLFVERAPIASSYDPALEIVELESGHVVLSSLRSATWMDPDVGIVGNVSASNSLLPGDAQEPLPLDFRMKVQPQSDGNYLVISRDGQVGLDSITPARGTVGIADRITSANSVLINNFGSTPGPDVAYDPVLHQTYVPVFARDEIVIRTLSTLVTLSASPDPATRGQRVTLTAFVLGTEPEGIVEFRVGDQTLPGCGAVALQGTGDVRHAVCEFASATARRLVLTARYRGDVRNYAATSHASSLDILPGVDDILADGFEGP